MKATLSLRDPDVLIIVTWAVFFCPENSIHQVPVKLYGDPATSKHVCVDCGCFCASVAKRTSYNRDCVASKVENTYYPAFELKIGWPLFSWVDKSGTVTAVVLLTPQSVQYFSYHVGDSGISSDFLHFALCLKSGQNPIFSSLWIL